LDLRLADTRLVPRSAQPSGYSPDKKLATARVSTMIAAAIVPN
jgi:hypothetical protein